MAGNNKKINYKEHLEVFIKSHFPGLKIENTVIDHVSNVLNVVQAKLIEAMENETTAVNKIDQNTFHKCAKITVEKTYSGRLKDHAMSEAYKQIALLQSGCMTYGDEPSIYKKVKKVEITEKVMSKMTALMINKFSAGVGRLVSVSQPNLNFEKRAQILLGRRMHNFAKILAQDADGTFPDKKELTHGDIRAVVIKYFGLDAMKSAHGEGNKHLALYENGMLEFTAKRRISMKQTAAYEQMFALAFKNGLKDLLNDMSPRAHMDNKAPRFLALTLLEIARYLGSRAVELLRREKMDTMGDEHLERAVSISFPEQLREHALLKAADDLSMFDRGVLTYRKTPDQPKSKIASKRKAALPPKKVPEPKKVRRLPPKPPAPPSRRRSKSKAPKIKRARPKPKPKPKPKSTKRPSSLAVKSSQKPKPKSKPKRKKPSVKKTEKEDRETYRGMASTSAQLNFGPAMVDLLPAVFGNSQIILAKETITVLNETLDQVYEIIASISLEMAAGSEELDWQHVRRTVQELFPENLAKHAIPFAMKVLNSWRAQNPTVHDTKRLAVEVDSEF
ncbi:uncharacterized protein CDAR_429521 [Caerostris darwini]|uniref:Uncharacterized protein n=1 Tax=Caerostris darwini TaxID=1538125 RepID=A0AAV4MAU8_9ARAC|nr:uncharacterized protein CDAR_429521 [Caerostris darwini]